MVFFWGGVGWGWGRGLVCFLRESQKEPKTMVSARRQLDICFFVCFYFQAPTSHRQLSLNTTPESAWEGSCGDRVGQDGFLGLSATLAACSPQPPPRVPTNQQRSILEWKGALTYVPVRQNSKPPATPPDFHNISVHSPLPARDEVPGLTLSRQALDHSAKFLIRHF